jgi:hypothetical protein
MATRTVRRPNITSRYLADADISTDHWWIIMGHSGLKCNHTKYRKCRHIRCQRQSPDRRERVLFTKNSERPYRSHRLLSTSAGYNEELRQKLKRRLRTQCFLEVHSLSRSCVDSYVDLTLADFGWTKFA